MGFPSWNGQSEVLKKIILVIYEFSRNPGILATAHRYITGSLSLSRSLSLALSLSRSVSLSLSLSRSLSVKSARPFPLHPHLSQTRPAHFSLRVSHSSPWGDSEGPSGHLQTGWFKGHFWSPRVLAAGPRVGCLGRETAIPEPPLSAWQRVDPRETHRKPAFFFLSFLFRVNKFGVDSLDSPAFPILFWKPWGLSVPLFKQCLSLKCSQLLGEILLRHSDRAEKLSFVCNYESFFFFKLQ